ncbi:hypothetical protein [Inhella gelatinilytica]|uniref:Tetratricopeptide repeat protein n=1 Tax=Inhella gelatinilytica TaxID=2795030 RepID=A0A931J1L9_9BURK|nr:hypothetical protein [Inhella gelatinilytica]MBH9553696.1 hypothetical protein [Inhella gelatinilytica]
MLPELSPTSECLRALRGRLSAVAQRHPACAVLRLLALERALRARGEVADALDALYLRFYLLEHRGRAMELAPALTDGAREASMGGWRAQTARLAEALGRVAYQQGHYVQANEQWTRALNEAEVAQDARVAVSARIGLGQIHYAMGAWASGLRCHREAAVAQKALADDYLAAKLALNLGVGLLELGHVEEAERQFAHALAASRRGGHPEFEAEAHWYLARAALARGDLNLASADCRVALGLAGRLHHQWLEAAASRTWTDIALARGDEASAVRSLQHSLDLAERIQAKPQQRLAHRQLAQLLERRGDLAGALDHLWRVVALGEELESQHPVPGQLGAPSLARAAPSRT